MSHFKERTGITDLDIEQYSDMRLTGNASISHLIHDCKNAEEYDDMIDTIMQIFQIRRTDMTVDHHLNKIFEDIKESEFYSPDTFDRFSYYVYTNFNGDVTMMPIDLVTSMVTDDFVSVEFLYDVIRSIPSFPPEHDNFVLNIGSVDRFFDISESEHLQDRIIEFCQRKLGEIGKGINDYETIHDIIDVLGMRNEVEMYNIEREKYEPDNEDVMRLLDSENVDEMIEMLLSDSNAELYFTDIDEWWSAYKWEHSGRISRPWLEQIAVYFVNNGIDETKKSELASVLIHHPNASYRTLSMLGFGRIDDFEGLAKIQTRFPKNDDSSSLWYAFLGKLSPRTALQIGAYDKTIFSVDDVITDKAVIGMPESGFGPVHQDIRDILFRNPGPDMDNILFPDGI